MFWFQKKKKKVWLENLILPYILTSFLSTVKISPSIMIYIWFATMKHTLTFHPNCEILRSWKFCYIFQSWAFEEWVRLDKFIRVRFLRVGSLEEEEERPEETDDRHLMHTQSLHLPLPELLSPLLSCLNMLYHSGLEQQRSKEQIQALKPGSSES